MHCLRVSRLLPATLCVFAVAAAAAAASQPRAQSVLAACNSSDALQQWQLRADWGANNTLISTSVPGLPFACLDIAEWNTSPGALVGPYQCCCDVSQNSTLCTDCGHGRWYNQVFSYDANTGAITSSRPMESHCLTAAAATPGAVVSMYACASGSAATQSWTFDAAAPRIHLKANPQLCLSASAHPGPSPPPPPPPALPPCENTTLPFCNTSLTPEERAADLVSRMTLEEKMTQLSTNSFTSTHGGTTPGVPRLGVPPYNYHTEGLHGIRDSTSVGLNATMFPQVTAMAATGNLSLVNEMAMVMGRELRAMNNVAKKGNILPHIGAYLSIYGPTMNIIRDPRWGRSQESVSEDPWLNGAYAVNFVRGIQGDMSKAGYLQVACTCKHLDAYSLEKADGFSRHDFDANVTQQDLADTYLPAFETCVEDGHPQQVMCSYNSINGIPACLRGDIQNDLLRSKWGFDGSVVSDCDAIKDAYQTHKYSKTPQAASAQGIIGGCDQDCGETYGLYTAKALQQGLIQEATVDTALARILLMRFRLGEFDPADMVPYRKIPPTVIENNEALASSLRASQEAIVLLQNNASLLPLFPNPAGRNVALIGAIANETSIMAGGKSDYHPSSVVSLYDGLVAHGAAVSYAKGCDVTGSDKSGFKAAVAAAKSAGVAIVAVGMSNKVEHEGGDRSIIGLTGVQEDLVKAVAAAVGPQRVIVVYVNGGPVSSTWIKENIPTVVECWYNGMFAGTALAQVLWGDVNPSGVLPFSVLPEDYVDKAAMSNMNMRADAASGYPGRTYRFYTGTPLYPFGHGLSYTTFTLKWDSSRGGQPRDRASTTEVLPGAGQPLSYSVVVTNTGETAGAKVVQLFVSPPAQDRVRGTPAKSLFGMQKVHLAPGKSATLKFKSSGDHGGLLRERCAFCVAGEDGRWRLLDGDYTVTAGAYAELRHTVRLSGGDQVIPGAAIDTIRW